MTVTPTLTLTAARITRETPRVNVVEFVAADGGALPAFTAGAHIDLMLGNGEERSYSLLNDQGETHRYLIGVQREHDGRGGSAWLHDALREGDVLAAQGPSNDFALSEGGAFHVLIGGGIGITPMLSMAARLQAIGRDYHLHYATRSRAEAAFVDELLARHGERVTLYHDDGDSSRGLDVVKLLATRPPAAHAYVCGPAGMIRATREAGRHWPTGTVHFESFGVPTADVVADPRNQPFDIVLNKSGRNLTIGAHQSILDVLRGEGVRVRSLCNDGICGTCRVELISGLVDHRDDCLDDDERDEALQVCVSRAKPGQTLVLDL